MWMPSKPSSQVHDSTQPFDAVVGLQPVGRIADSHGNLTDSARVWVVLNPNPQGYLNIDCLCALRRLPVWPDQICLRHCSHRLDRFAVSWERTSTRTGETTTDRGGMWWQRLLPTPAPPAWRVRFRSSIGCSRVMPQT